MARAALEVDIQTPPQPMDGYGPSYRDCLKALATVTYVETARFSKKF
jgi:hypothetical protein